MNYIYGNNTKVIYIKCHEIYLAIMDYIYGTGTKVIYILRVTKYILQSCIICMGLALKSKDTVVTVVYRKSETGLTYV